MNTFSRASQFVILQTPEFIGSKHKHLFLFAQTQIGLVVLLNVTGLLSLWPVEGQEMALMILTGSMEQSAQVALLGQLSSVEYNLCAPVETLGRCGDPSVWPDST